MPKRSEKLRRCLLSLDLPEKTALFVAYQGESQSKNEIESVLPDYQDKVSCLTVYADQNYGVSGGRQRQVNVLRTLGLNDDDIVVFLDDDLYAMNHSWLPTLIAPIQEGRCDIAGVEPRIVTYNYMTIPALSEECDYVSGGWCAVAGRVFNAGVEFDPQFFPYGWEDVDFCYSAREQGFRVLGVQNVLLIHDQHMGNIEHFKVNRARFRAKWSYEGQKR